MHYYQFHIGDYMSHTRHLSLMEDLAYRRLLDFYFLHEQPIKHRDVARQISMREHEEDVLTVLNEFFISTADGFVNPRADKEIRQFKEYVEAGKRGAAKRWSKENDSPPIAPLWGGHSPPNPPLIATNNQQPITNTHKPTSKVNTNTLTKVNTPQGVSIEVWESFVAQRKLSKATVTQTVINSIQREADKAGFTLEQALAETVTRGWRSFKADWVKDKPQGQTQQLKSFKQMDEERSKERYNLMVGRSTSRVIDITPDNFLEIN
jgi:uncharacterized protein YdaU (DUF1376 family)